MRYVPCLTEPELGHHLVDHAAVGSNLTVYEIAAANQCIRGLKRDGLWTKLLRVDLFLGSNLAGKLLALKRGTGDTASWTKVGAWTNAAYWTGHGIGNGTSLTEYLRSGFVPSSEGLSVTDMSAGLFFLDDTRNRTSADNSNFYSPWHISAPAGLATCCIGNDQGTGGPSNTSVGALGPSMQCMSLTSGTIQNTYGYMRQKKDGSTQNTVASPVEEMLLFAGCYGSLPNPRVGNGRVGFHFIGHALTYAEMQTLTKHVTTMQITLGAFVGYDQGVVVFGDSIGQGQGVTAPQRWSRQVAAHYGLPECNLAIPSGRLATDVTTTGFVRSGLNRYTDMAFYNPRKVYLALGTNDAHLGDLSTNGDPVKIAAYKAALVTVIQYCQTTLGVNNTISNNLFVLGLPWWGPTITNDTKRSAYIVAQQQACTEQGAIFIDIYGPMLAGGGDTLTQDHLHPTAAGHTCMATAIIAAG